MIYDIGSGHLSHDKAVDGTASRMFWAGACANRQPRRRQYGLVFGLGAMIRELVVNRLPFMITSMIATLESIAHGLPRHHHRVDADGGRGAVTGMGLP